MSKTALVTGINGMDGSHLADFLLKKGYTVYGLERRSSASNRTNISHIEDKIHFLKGDLTDQNSLLRALKESNPKLTGREVFSTIAMMWKKQNEANASATASARVPLFLTIPWNASVPA